MTQPNPTPTDALREKIAREIDPRPFEYEAKSVRAKYFQDMDQKIAFHKADKILALLPPPDAALQALDFYASKHNYSTTYTRNSKVQQDGGRLARQALATPTQGMEGE